MEIESDHELIEEETDQNKRYEDCEDLQPEECSVCWGKYRGGDLFANKSRH